MVSEQQQIEKLQREIEKLLADSMIRMEKERTLFLQKLAKIDAKIEALVNPPPPKPKQKRKPRVPEQLPLIE